MSNVGNIGFFEKYGCVSFFGKIKNKCFTFGDVRKMADEYEANILKVTNDCDVDIKKAKEVSKKILDELNAKIDELQNNIKDMTELHNRTNVSKEKMIDDLTDKVHQLKIEIRDKDKDHASVINNLVCDNSSKLNRIKTECADALLKADKKNNKTTTAKEEAIVEEIIDNAVPEVQVVEDKAVVVKKQRALSGTPALTKEQIEEVKIRRKNGEKSKDLAAEYKVHRATIDRAIKK